MVNWIKKGLCIVISVFMLCVSTVPAAAISQEEFSSPSVLLMEAESGNILFEKNSHEVRACASITKVMTLLLVFEAIDAGKFTMEDTVTASAHAASMGGSDIWLEEGETMTVDEMIKATVVASANDAAVALAELTAGSEEAFVENMNTRAKELGMNDTTFKNCNGLDEEGHLSSAHDVALMSRELIKHKEIFDYSTIWMDNLRDGATQIVNTNKLLKSYTGITGLKTGTTGDAGSCITATATREDFTLIAVVLGSETGTQRFKDASALLDHGFANYARYKPEITEEIPLVKVTGGMQPEVWCKPNISGNFVVEKGSNKNVTYEIQLKENVDAPVYVGDKLGNAIFKNGDTVVAQYPIVAQNNVEQMNFGSVFTLLFKCLVNL